MSKPLEDVVKECGAMVTTLVPEQYKPTAIEAKTHNIMGQPWYIASNSNGDFLWTGIYTYIFFSLSTVHFHYVEVVGFEPKGRGKCTHVWRAISYQFSWDSFICRV